jgi:hypothetical protein
MINEQVYSRIIELRSELANLPFPHEDCAKIQKHLNSKYWFKPDLSSFRLNIWYVCAIEKLSQKDKASLEHQKSWMHKSFFERFPEYKSVLENIDYEESPLLVRTLELCEELRKSILCLVEDKLKSFD